MRSFDSAPQFDGFSKVVIVVSEDVEHSAGTDTGRTLTITNPWGTQQMANNILSKIKGHQYQPYTATDAIIDPAAELGDGITVNNVYSGIYTQKIKFGPMLTATVSAPEDEETDHEYPYKSKQERTVTRNLRNLTTELRVQAGLISAEVAERKSDVASINGKLTVQATQISAEVSERKSETESLRSSLSLESSRITAEIQTRSAETSSLQSSLNIQAEQISAKVSKTGGSSSSFGWNLADSYWELVSGDSTVLKATSSGLEVRGKITALSGTIGGFTITSNSLSYNNQTWGGTNSTGIYLGPNGIQCGPAANGVQITPSGALYAENGYFRGNVNAGNIQYGGSSGYLSGSGLTSYSVSDLQIAGSTLSTAKFTRGVNISLGYADYANGVFGGWNTASYMYASTVRAKSSLYVDGTFYIKRNGVSHAVRIRNLTIDGVIYGVLTI